MDATFAIENNRAALLRIAARLVVMAGWASARSESAGPAETRQGEAAPLVDAGEGVDDKSLKLPRAVRLAILRILRPAEAATRRLAIALSRSLPPLPPIRLRKMPPKPKQEYFEISPRNVVHPGQRKTGILMPRNSLKRIGPDGTIVAYLIPKPMPFVPAPPPRRHQTKRRARSFSFALLDPLPNPMRARRKYAPRHSQPRVWSLDTPRPVYVPPASPRDQVNAAPLARRMAMLADALSDLPKQARRYQRWQALRAARKLRETQTGVPSRRGRLSPLKPGRPPGSRIASWDPNRTYRSKRIRKIDEILARTHDMALYALERHDTS